MISRPIEQVTAGDVEALVTDQRPEGRTIEYKQELPGGTDSDKREFLADVASFANAAGGDLVYGIKDARDAAGKATGLPEAVVGVSGTNLNEQLLKLNQIIRSGIDPRIPGYQVNAVEGFAHGQPVIIVLVARSWAGPHMVTHGGVSRFYSRTSAGKHQLDVREIRAAFDLAAGATDRMQRFVTDRLGRILARETPIAMVDGAKLVLHLLPLTAFDPGSSRSASGFPPKHTHAVPLYSSGNTQPNFDGQINYNWQTDVARSEGYCQLFRNGIIEAVDAAFHWVHEDGRRAIRGTLLERQVIAAVGRYLDVEKELGVEPPLYLVLSMVGARGYSMFNPQGLYSSRQTGSIDREVLSVPEILIEDVQVDVPAALRPAFDVIWQSSGFPRSFNYDEAGKWNPPR